MRDSIKLLIKDPKLPPLRRRGVVIPSVYYEGYGALYNGHAVLTGNLAPTGWHVPTLTELETLIAYLGGDTVAGGKLKETGTIHWNTPNTASNESEFSAVGGGERTWDGKFDRIKEFAYFMSITEGPSLSMYWLEMGSDSPGITFGYYGYGVNYGNSIRLIKNDSTLADCTDYDGNVYRGIKIGDQVWTNANLVVEHLNDGTPIPNITSDAEWTALTTPGMCFYSSKIYSASVDPETLTWATYGTDEKFIKVTTNLERWYLGAGSSYTGFTLKVYNTDGVTEIVNGEYHDGYYIGVKPVNSNAGGTTRNFSINIDDWRGQTLATASGSQPAGVGPNADAGTSKNMHGTLTAVMDAVPSLGGGVWTQDSGPGSTSFSNAFSPTTTVTVSVYGGYRYTWTETYMGVSDSDDTTITFYP